ncbi:MULTISPECIES: S8 family serine peptidase [unclassified Isoptericola]|uniref:S8 family serine peptidase n=1 Tax=unclassified Isoptericola TaxID=2623355 RepID=UPI003664254C
MSTRRSTPAHAGASRARRGGRAAAVWAAALGTVLALAAPGSAATAAAGSVPGTADASEAAAAAAKVPPGLERQLEQGKPVDLWIEFDARADLTRAAAIDDWDERGAAVADALRATAERSQRGAKARLRAAGVEFQSFWATNAIKVTGADEALATSLATDHEVAALWPEFAVTEPTVTAGEAEATVDAVEWGIANIKADQAWQEEGARGEGIVVANLDTGVQYDHPALVRQYRGNNGDGTFTHDYNWFDARGVCPTDAPCDDHGHGTHTMGTMVGDDGGTNHIGVAPDARWIATNGCCESDATIIASAQWLLEPTDLHGANPKASMRPQVINNSWGSNLPSTQPFLEDISAAWTASGIFVSWSNGNIGPQCATSGRPGSRTINYSVGAYDSTNRIADFSSRGAGQDGEVKPDIAAPGVNVRSAQPGGQYASMNGTSMASPHVAGAVALLWSARPAARGDVEGTRELLARTAIDTTDLSCGGTAENNNVYGEGRLDALALVEAVPAGPAGKVAGTVTDAATGEPLAAAQVSVAGATERSMTTGSDGAFEFRLPVGTYRLDVTRFGYAEPTSVDVEVTQDGTLDHDVALDRLPSATVSGTVTDGSGQGWPLYARVRVPGTPVTAYTDPATGEYSVVLPVGSSYDVVVESTYPGYAPATDAVTVAGDVVHDKALTVADCAAAAGYAADCAPAEGGIVVGHVTDALTGDGVVGARVQSVDAPDDTTTSVAAGSDRALGDGFYWLFSSLTGAHDFTARLGGAYAPGTTGADVRAHAATTADFALGAGRLEVGTTSVSGAVELGGAVTREVEVRNVGNAPATFELADREQGFEVALADGGTVTPWDVASAGTTEPRRVEADVSPLRGGAAPDGAGPGSDEPTVAGAQAAPWVDLADHPTAVMDNVAATYRGVTYSVGGTFDGVDGTADVYAYDPRTLRWDEKEPMPQARMKPGGAFVDDRLYVIGGWGAPGSMVDVTAIYDPRTDSWTTGAKNPQPMAAAGVAALDGVVYSVGGCTATCGSAVVTAYDVAADAYRTVARYPVATAWTSCGALEDRIVCAGGVAGGTASRSAYAYDPSTDTWTQLTDMPRAVWAAGYAAADGRLLVSGGVADNALTNEGWAYDPDADAWTGLPASGDVVYRGAAACGFVRVGGSSDGNFRPTVGAEMLPGYDDCTGHSSDAAWLSAGSGEVTLDPGESTRVEVRLDSTVLGQPGEYTAQLRLVEDTPTDVAPIDVTLTVTPPRSWGKVLGTVSGVSCTGAAAPAAGAAVSVAGSASTWSFTVPADGSYARWVDRGENPLTVTAHLDGFVPESRTVRVGSRPTQVDLALDRLAC